MSFGREARVTVTQPIHTLKESFDSMTLLERGSSVVSRHSAWWERENQDMLFGIKLCW